MNDIKRKIAPNEKPSLVGKRLIERRGQGPYGGDGCHAEGDAYDKDKKTAGPSAEFPHGNGESKR